MAPRVRGAPHQDVDVHRQGGAVPVQGERGGSGEQRVRTRVQQRGPHALVRVGARVAEQHDPGQHPPPGAPGPAARRDHVRRAAEVAELVHGGEPVLRDDERVGDE
ncbi:hypothetical protein [Streptomyces sp. CC228A]|uniref:hypothetical protein n=1 Tax=Streptomyces sp. CC228A TaxID=2898186 RepID=UPI001F3D705B|nr:hypothetical protein [Streptomyces sp. CC228A]